MRTSTYIRPSGLGTPATLGERPSGQCHRLLSVLAGLSTLPRGPELVQQISSSQIPLREWQQIAEKVGHEPERFARAAELRLRPVLSFEPPEVRLRESSPHYQRVLASFEKSLRDASLAALYHSIPPGESTPAEIETRFQAVLATPALVRPDLAALFRSIPGHLEKCRATIGAMTGIINGAQYNLHEPNHLGFAENIATLEMVIREALARAGGGAILNLACGPGGDTGFFADCFPDVPIIADAFEINDPELAGIEAEAMDSGLRALHGEPGGCDFKQPSEAELKEWTAAVDGQAEVEIRAVFTASPGSRPRVPGGPSDHEARTALDTHGGLGVISVTKPL